VEDSDEFLVDFDERRVASDTVRDSVDVTDLHRELESAKRFRPNRLEESISDWEEEFGERDSSNLRDDVECSFRYFPDRGDLTAGFEKEETAEVVEGGCVSFEFLSEFSLVADSNDVVEGVDNHLRIRRGFSRHVLDCEDETSDDFDAVFRDSPFREVDFRG
jgi:hypothetical protein